MSPSSVGSSRHSAPPLRRPVVWLGAGVAALVVALSARADEGSTSLVWVGHQVVRGHRSIPVIGDVETVVDTYTIAQVTKKGGQLAFQQKACAVRFKEVMGVQTTMSEGAIARLPEARFSFTENNGKTAAAPWAVGWDRKDIDRDGNPGVTIHVDSSLCGGDLYVGSDTTSRAKGRMTSDGMAGTIDVHVKQKIFGASGWCLSQASSDTEERQTGAFAYRRANPGTDCASLDVAHWPVRAQ